MAGNLTAMIAAAFAGGVVSDEYFEYTTLLLPGNGTNGAQNNTFLDSGTANSGSGFTITRNGNTTQGTFSPFSQTGWGNYFNGSSYLTIADNAAFDFGSGNFTLEAWVNIGSSSGTKSIFSKVFDFGPFILLVDGTTVKYYLSSTGSSWNIVNGASGGTVSVGSWSHVALVRNGNIVTPYVNGIAGTTTTTSATLTSNIRALVIGADQTNGSGFVDIFNGYISNARIVKGVAVYSGTSTSTANFTVPTSPLTATQSAGTNIAAITGTETSLLTCQSNRFRDASSNNFAITVNGSPSVQAFSPFNPTSSWSAVTNGGSGYFDGTGDYLSVADNTALNIGTSDFQVSFWFYPTSFDASNCVFAKGSSNIFVGVTSSGVVVVSQYGGANIITTGTVTVKLNTWNYCVVSRVSFVTKTFVNGVETASASDSSNYTSSTAAQIGQDPLNSGQKITGYLADFRLVKNSGVTSVTVPTAPLTNITNTSLLLNFTNAGIYDATSKNDLETVGNAQISTAISAKWGSGSIRFNPGQTNPLIIPNNQFFNLSSGDFTIEAWVYLSSNRTYNFIISKGGGGTTREWGVNVGPTDLRFYWSTNGSASGDSTVSGSASLPTGTWMYIAVTRSGNSIRLFKDGNQVGSTGTFTSMYSGTDPVYVGRFMDFTNISHDLDGYLQDLRITKGYARYTSNFTAPTAAFPTL